MLATPFRVATAGSAAIALAAAAGVAMRQNEARSIRVDARRATAGLRSATLLRIDGAPPPPAWDPLSGFYETRDGWISVHCNFPEHRDAAARVLGGHDDRGAMAARARSWSGEALEEAIHAAGGCAGFARTADTWRRHPQAEAVAAQTLLSIERIAPSPPEPVPHGFRVLDLTRVLAGPTCARVLAEHGAEVLKINAPHLPHSGAIELDTGVGKRAAFLDLREAADVARLRALAATADVFSQSYRPGSLAARGLGPEALARARPGIVCVSLSAWGTTGPWAARRGFDSIVQSVSGMALAQGSANADMAGPPKTMPVSAIDYISGYLMAAGAMVALRRRAAEGGSWHVRVALARVGLWITDHGTLPDETWRGAPTAFADDDVARWCVEQASPVGRVRHMAPIAEIEGMPLAFRYAPRMPGADEPVWPDVPVWPDAPGCG